MTLDEIHAQLAEMMRLLKSLHEMPLPPELSERAERAYDLAEGSLSRTMALIEQQIAAAAAKEPTH